MATRMLRWSGAASAAALVLFGAATPGRAGDTTASTNPFTWAPPTIEYGKPAIFVPPPQTPPAAGEDCLPALPCGARLIGTVQKNGAVELSVPAWRW